METEGKSPGSGMTSCVLVVPVATLRVSQCCSCWVGWSLKMQVQSHGPLPANLALSTPAFIPLCVQKHFHQTGQGNLAWDWLFWGWTSACGGLGLGSRVLRGWIPMPMGIYHCRVRHRPVLYVGLVTEASNFL